MLPTMQLVALCFVVFAEAISPIASVPLFMWSPSQFFNKGKCSEWEVGTVMDLADLAAGIKKLSHATNHGNSESALLQHLVEKSPLGHPEALVAFMYPDLDTASGSRMSGAYAHNQADKMSPTFKFLQSALDKAVSCVAVPYLTTMGKSSGVSKV